MGKIENREFWQSARKNNWSYLQYYNRLVELAISMFDWKNVPDTIDVRFLELALFTDGKAVFFKDEELGYLALRCAISGPLNVYRIPIKRRAYAVNGYNKELDIDNSVVIFNNFLHINSMLDTEMFASRLYELDRIIDVNARAQKTPVLIQCEESQRLTMKNLYKEYDGNSPAIFGDKNLNPNALKVLETGAPFIGDKIYDLKNKYWNEALTYLGISNINYVKKQRLVADEVTRNSGSTIASRYSRLESRKEAAKQINAMFGLNIEVEYRDDTRMMDDIMLDSYKDSEYEGEAGNE